jgi:hypothetical protein
MITIGSRHRHQVPRRGLNQPLLDTMYADKKLGGVNAVQTLSRVNLTHPAGSRPEFAGGRAVPRARRS